VPAPIPIVFTLVPQLETIGQLPAPKPLQMFTRWPMVPAPLSVSDNSLYPVEGLPPQLSTTPSDLDIPIAF